MKASLAFNRYEGYFQYLMGLFWYLIPLAYENNEELFSFHQKITHLLLTDRSTQVFRLLQTPVHARSDRLPENNSPTIPQKFKTWRAIRIKIQRSSKKAVLPMTLY